MAMPTMENLLTVPFQLTDTLRKVSRQAGSYRVECAELNSKSERLTKLLRAIAHLDGSTGRPLYIRPLRRMLQELEKSLSKALILVGKCSRNKLIKRVITITSTHDFKRVSTFLENSIADITWFLTISASGENRAQGVGGMPPIASVEPLLGYCWEHIALLHRGTEEEREVAAVNLRAFGQINERFIKLMVEEEAIVPLLKVLQDGTVTAREAAARSLGDMAKDAEVVKQMIEHGLASVFVKVLHGASMSVQAAVAWALAETLDVDPEQQNLFLEQGVVRPLVALLGESLQEETAPKAEPPITMNSLMSSMAPGKVSVQSSSQQKRHQLVSRVPKLSNIPAPQGPRYNAAESKPPIRPSLSPLKPSNHVQVGRATYGAAERMNGRNTPGRHMENSRGLTQRELNRRGRENADPELKAELRAEVARALRMLAKGNSRTCKSITETKALLCFATLMKKARGDVQLNSTMAVMAIAAVAESDVDLRRAAFKMSNPAAKAVVDQLLRLVEEGSFELKVACIKAIGFLSRTFPARETTRVVKPLVNQLEFSEDATSEAAVIALIKLVCEENFLHKEHSRAIMEASAAPQLVQLIFSGRGELQLAAVTLMCYLALHGGESAALAKAEPLPPLKNFARNMSEGFAKNPHLHSLEKLLHHAINHLEIYHGRDVFDPYFFD